MNVCSVCVCVCVCDTDLRACACAQLSRECTPAADLEGNMLGDSFSGLVRVERKTSSQTA